MFKHNIKIPREISNKEIIKYFKKYKLDKLDKKYLKNSKNTKLTIQKNIYEPELRDLYRLHEFILLNKRICILEFGCGWSSLVMLNALLINKKRFNKEVAKLRYNNPFEIFIVDNERKYLNIAKKRIHNFFENNALHAKFNFSDVEMSLFNNRICNSYKKLPNINPDFIYLDGPDQFHVKKNIKGLNIKNPDLMPMNSDILMIEPFLKPGTIILTDGRTSNFRFLYNNLQRNWIAKEDNINDQHILYLNEKPLGLPNLSQLKFYQ